MKKIAALAMLIGMGGCTTGTITDPDPVAAQSGGETLTFSLNSWGKPIQYWQLQPNGKGEIRIYAEGADFYSYTVERYHIDVTPEGYEGVRAELADFISGKIADVPCKKRITDQAYGSLQWSSASQTGKFAFDTGCMDDDAAPIFKKLHEADIALREIMVRDEKPFETSEVKQN